jgi:hypothetical protein
MPSPVRSVSVHRWIDSELDDGIGRLVGDVDRMTPSALIAFYVAPRFEDINLK